MDRLRKIFSSEESKNTVTSGMFYELRQMKNAFMGELEKLNTPLLNDVAASKDSSVCEDGLQENRISVSELPQDTECEICMDSLVAKSVYSCSTCHNLLCSSCLVKVHSCPFCRSQGKFAVRNIALERLLSKLHLPCKNQRYGCKEYVDRNTRKRHEKHCLFNPFKCPYVPGCRWSGDVEQLKVHLENYHSLNLVQNNYMRVKIRHVWSKLKMAYNHKKAYCTILYCYQLVFVCKLTLFQDNIFISFLQVNLFDDNSNKNHYGVGIEVSGSCRTVRGIVPLPVPGAAQKISLPLKSLLLSDDFKNDKIIVSIDIKDLPSILLE